MKKWITKNALIGEVWVDEDTQPYIGEPDFIITHNEDGRCFIVETAHAQDSAEEAIKEIARARFRETNRLRRELYRLEAIDIPALVASAPVVRKAGE